MQSDTSRPWLALAPLALALLVLVAACGGGSPKSAATTTTTTAAGGRRANAAALQAFRDCMQQHGVTLPTGPPRPKSSEPPSTVVGAAGDTGGGARFRGGPGGLGASIDSADPATKAAFQACQGQLPAGFLQRIQQGQTARQAYRSCMQSHGVTVTGFGSTTSTTPEFTAANNICKALLPARGGAGPGGGGPGAGPGDGSPTTAGQ